MDVFLDHLGCRLNEAELETWSRDLRAAGHRVLAGPEGAQVMVLNTCAVTGRAAKQSRQRARRLHRSNPAGKLVVTGCYAALEPEATAALQGVDRVVGNRGKDALLDVLSELDVPEMPALATEPDGAHVYAEGRTRAFVKVQDGCRNRCTFCIVTVARGEERSRTIDAVVDEVATLHAGGFQEVVLTGVHIGGAGSDRGYTLRDLLAAVLDRTAVPRVRIGSLEPWDLPDDFFDLWADPRLCPHLHLPLQSGSDPVLRRMARRCPVDRYLALVDRARAAIADLTLTTDLIVGFPGETDGEFAESLATLRAVGFAHVHLFTYSARAGTAAARMPHQVPAAVKKRRSRAAHAVASDLKAAHLAAAVGQTRPVLWEGRGQPVPGGRRWGGYTDHYLRVEAVSADDLHNRIVPAKLEAVLDGERLRATL